MLNKGIKEAYNNKLFFILILAFGIRALGLNYSLRFDEADWAIEVKNILSHGYVTQLIPHPPIAKLAYVFSGKIFGVITISMRLVPLLISMFVIFMIYKVGKEVYDKKTGMLAIFIAAISFYHILASIQVDADGSFLTFFVMTSLYSYLRFKETRHSKWLFYSGLSFGLALLTKYPAIIIIPILLLYDFFSSRLKNFKSIIHLSFIGFFFFLLFPVVSFLIEKPELFLLTLSRGGTSIMGGMPTNLYEILFSIMKHTQHLFEYGTPILSLGAILAYCHKQNEKEWLLFSWVGIYLLFYTFIISVGANYRYMMVMIPPLCILTSRTILNLFEKITRKDLLISGASVLVFSIILLTLNIFHVAPTRLTNSNVSFDLVLKNAQLWFGSNSGPVFAISIYSLLFVSGLSLILFLLILYPKQKKNARKYMLLLITLNLTYNFLLIHELYSPSLVPNHNKVISELRAYYEKNELPEPIYLSDLDLKFYLDCIDCKTINSLNMENDITKNGGSVILLNVPPEKWELKFLDKCKLHKTFYSKGYETAYVFTCQKRM